MFQGFQVYIATIEALIATNQVNAGRPLRSLGFGPRPHVGALSVCRRWSADGIETRKRALQRWEGGALLVLID